MKDAQKPDHVSLTTLLSRLRDGRFVIPDFQREFEWKPWDIRDLMRSIFLDYYIGSLLLWKGKNDNFEALACEPIYGYEGASNPEHIVLDGQQRLTAMYYTFFAPDISVPNRANRFLYFIRVDEFMDEAYDEAFEYDWTQRGVNLLESEERQFQEHMFPLAIIGKSGWALPNWVQGYEQYWRERADAALESGSDGDADHAQLMAENAKAFGDHLKGITEQYQIAFIELDKDLEIDKVCDIFTQINSKGIRLDAFDLINALLKPKGLQLKHMWREAAPRLDFVESGRLNVYVLQVMSILRQAYCSPKYLYFLLPGQEKSVRDPDGTRRKEILIPDAATFERLWEKAVTALEKAIDLLKHPQEFGAISSGYLPYVSILPAFAALQAHARSLPANRKLDAQRKIRQWYWASVFTNRYSGSVESTSARDFQDVKAWCEDDEAEPGLMTEFRSRFKNLDLRKETKGGSSVYNGIFNLLVLNGARDWMTGNLPQYGDLDDHHVVPRSWGADNDLGNEVHTILNRTPLTPETNRNVIADRLPNTYLPEMIRDNGEETVREILASHLISPVAMGILLRDPFTPDDFEEFVAERQRTIQEAIESLLIKARVDLSPRLRELDERVEEVELGLRELIAGELDGDENGLPSHVSAKAKDRIQRKAKKNAGMDLEEADTLPGMLEFCDLRELQDTIVNKKLWPLFEPHFSHKETLINRFDQLGELRNGIRHSRSVDTVTQKDGEAAILWFEKALKGAAA